MSKLKVCLFALILGVPGWFGYQHHVTFRRLQAHVRGQNVMRMTGLRMWLERAAALDPSAFSSAVGTGLVVEATSLPSLLPEDFPAETNVDDLRDTFGRPFHVAISLTLQPLTNTFKYKLSTWSHGPNGSNEFRKGDDIPSPDTTVEARKH